MRKNLLFSLLSLLFINTLTAQNLLTNGNFELGNTGFTTDYQYFANAPLPNSQQKAYGIVTVPSAWFSLFSNCTDHTSGSGKMMVLDGSITNGGNDKFWSQTVSTSANINYTFSYWVQTVAIPPPAVIAVKINGVLLGTNVAPSVSTCGNWTQYFLVWNSGSSTSATIEMYDTNIQIAGNDFAIDDLSFNSQLEITVPNSQSFCNGTLLPSLNFNSNQPGTTFSWTNSNPLLPIGGQGTGNISNVLATNSSSTPIVATITVTGSLSGFVNNVKQFTITINPTPKVVVNNIEKCKGDTSPGSIRATPATPGTYSYAWTVPLTATNPGNVAVINNATVAGNYTVVITNTATGCVSESATGTLQYIINCCPNEINIPVPETLCDNASCTPLTASFLDVKATTSYTVASIPYAPLVPLGNAISQNVCTQDDRFSDPLNLPFKFSFFGTCYNQFQIGTNTLLTFTPNPTRLCNSGAGSGYSFNQQIPFNFGDPQWMNAIYFPMQDTDPSVSSTPPVSITYKVDGFYPCRRAIIDVKNMPLFQCGTTLGLQESQLVLYEGTNIIDIYVKRRSVCSWNSGSGVLGIQNAAGTLAYTPSNRNTGTWQVLGTAAFPSEGWRFTPSGASLTSFKWLDASGATIGTTPSISVCPTATTTYTAQVKYTECSLLGPPTTRTVSKDITIDVYPDDTLNPVDIINCANNNFNLTSNATVVLGSLPAGSYDTPTYFTSLSDAQNGLNPITNPSSYSIPSGTSQTIYMNLTSTSNICVRVKPFKILFSTPLVYNQAASIFSNQAVGANFNLSTSTSLPTASYNVTGLTLAPGLTISGGNPQVATGLLAADLANDVFTNSSTTPLNAVYTVVPVSATGCLGTPFTVTITVMPQSGIIRCSKEVVGVNFNSPIIVAATYNVTALNLNGLTVFAGNPQVANGLLASALADDAYINTTNAPVDVIYTVEPVSASGVAGASYTITVTVNATTALPIVTPVTYCQGATATALSATGTGLLWYNVATGGTGSTTAIIPSTALAGTTIYYVSQTVSGCEGPRAPISVIVNATPVLPTVTTPVTYCQGAAASPLSATGTGLLWYGTPFGGTGSAIAPTPSTTTVGTITYYVSQTILGCEGPRAAIAVTVNATPATPSVTTPVTYCQGSTATALTASGTSLLWYASLTGGTGSVTPPTPSTLSAGVTTYYVSQTVIGCEGQRAPIVVTINPIPALPTVITPVTYCQGATASALSATGTGLLWYTAPTGGTGSSVVILPSTSNVGSTTYYVSQTVSGCKSPRAPIVVTVNATPALPTVTSPVTYCQNDSATALSATGTGLLWYTTPTGGAGSATAPTPSTA
uniref:Ig-like domain-containing protein n=1 Tax=Flavobacterium sp. TaxID=239 RepID=UPI0033414E2E